MDFASLADAGTVVDNGPGPDPAVISDRDIACDVGEWFSYTGHGFIRINLATDTKYIKTAVESLIKNLKELNGLD